MSHDMITMREMHRSQKKRIEKPQYVFVQIPEIRNNLVCCAVFDKISALLPYVWSLSLSCALLLSPFLSIALDFLYFVQLKQNKNMETHAHIQVHYRFIWYVYFRTIMYLSYGDFAYIKTFTHSIKTKECAIETWRPLTLLIIRKHSKEGVLYTVVEWTKMSLWTKKFEFDF